MKYLPTSLQNRQKLALLASYLVIFVFIFYLNQLTPLWGDDWWRAVNVEDYLSIFNRIKEEYIHWTGRSTVLLLTFIGLLKYPGNELVFSVVNSAIFVLLIQALFIASTGKKPEGKVEDICTIAIAFFSIWFFTQSFGESVLWKTGAVAYLWVITASIYLLLPYVKLLVQQQASPNTWPKLTLVPLFSFLVAISLENVAAAITAFMLYTLLVAKVTKVKSPAWLQLTFVAYLLGTIVLLSAPGNFRRFDMQNDGIPIYKRFGDLLAVVWEHGVAETFAFIVIAVLLIIAALQQKVAIRSLKNLKVWFIIALMLALSMIGSTGVNFGDRTAFVAEICFILVIVGLSYQVLTQAKPFIVWALPTIVLLLMVFSADMLVTLEQYKSVAQQHERRLALMQEYKANGVSRILLPSMKVPYIDGLKDDIISNRFFLRDIHGDTPGNGWRNGTYAQYYGFDFAIRLNKPYLIYLPEIVSATSQFKRVGQGERWVLLSKQESRGFSEQLAVYLISPRQDCINAAAVSFAQNGKATMQQWKARNDVALLSKSGVETDKYCVIKENIVQDQKGLKDTMVAINTRSGPIKLDLSARIPFSAPLPAFLDTKSLTWKACRLNTSALSRVNQADCSVENKQGEGSGFITFGPYNEVESGRYRVELELMSESGNDWDIVIQHSNVRQIIGKWAIPNTHQRRQLLSYEFDISHDITVPIKLEVRTAYNGKGKLKVFGLTLIPLD